MLNSQSFASAPHCTSLPTPLCGNRTVKVMTNGTYQGTIERLTFFTAVTEKYLECIQDTDFCSPICWK